MLSGNTPSPENSDAFAQFEQLLLQEGVPFHHYEKNGFTEMYLADFLQRRQDVLKELLAKCSGLKAFNPQDYEFLKAFIALEEQRKTTTEAKNAIESLTKNADAIEKDLSHLAQIVIQAKSDFESWGQADCKRGIEDLRNATTSVLAKKEEYRRRLGTLNATLESEMGVQGRQIQLSTINTVDLMEEILAKQKSLKQLEGKLEPFNKLPPDLTLASIEVERARAELESLLRERERMMKSF